MFSSCSKQKGTVDDLSRMLQLVLRILRNAGRKSGSKYPGLLFQRIRSDPRRGYIDRKCSDM